MNFHFPRIHFGPSYTEILAGIRDQIIEHGTALRFLVADKPVPQPRDEATGRFVSKRDRVKAQLTEYVATTTQEQRAQELQAYIEKARASTKQKPE